MQRARQAAGGRPAPLRLWRSPLRVDSPAVLGLGAPPGNSLRSLRSLCSNTPGSSQMWWRAARAGPEACAPRRHKVAAPAARPRLGEHRRTASHQDCGGNFRSRPEAELPIKRRVTRKQPLLKVGRYVATAARSALPSRPKSLQRCPRVHWRSRARHTGRAPSWHPPPASPHSRHLPAARTSGSKSVGNNSCGMGSPSVLDGKYHFIVARAVQTDANGSARETVFQRVEDQIREGLMQAPRVPFTLAGPLPLPVPRRAHC